MRRRNIKSVAHWVVMCFILLFPIVMVGISSFAQPQQEINVTETYEYETNEVNSENDLILGNIYKYHFDFTEYTTSKTIMYLKGLFIENGDYEFRSSDNSTMRLQYLYSSTLNNSSLQCLTEDGSEFVSRYYLTSNIFDAYIIYGGQLFTGITYENFTISDYLGEHFVDYTITDETMREDVNQWCASFRNLPVNVWYGNLLSAIGLGITTSMMMNVIYTYPLYVLWVYILDLVVDIFLVIINFGHNALKRLGGDNE